MNLLRSYLITVIANLWPLELIILIVYISTGANKEY